MTNNDVDLLESWVKTIPECSFIFLHSNEKVSSESVNGCISKFDIFFNGDNKLPFKLRNKVRSQFLDYYLGDKLFVYLNQFSISELNKVFNIVIESNYAANPKFIKWFLNKGVSTRSIVYITKSSEKETCDVNMLILNKNIHFYLDDKYLNERQASGVRPKDLLFYLTSDLPTNAHCPRVIDLLISKNPALLNSKTDSRETPLHSFMASFNSGIFNNPVMLGGKLISKKNINAQDNMWRTPLHMLLTENIYPERKDMIHMVKVLLKSGANIDLKDNDGITARELILKHPKLKVLL